MKTKNRNLNRLLKLARNLGSKHLIDVLANQEQKYSSDKIGSNVEYFYWAIEELPRMFKQWEDGHNGFPTLNSSEKLTTLAAVGYYFNLSSDELFHLLVPEFQDSKYLGKDLNRNSTPSELAHNIYQFVLFKEIEAVEVIASIAIRKEAKSNTTKKIKSNKPLKLENHETGNNQMSKLCA